MQDYFKKSHAELFDFSSLKLPRRYCIIIHLSFGRYKKISLNTEIIFNFGSSGALQQAIENGGETDLFFSAAQKQMDALEKSENILPETRKNLLENEIVLIVPSDSDKNIQNFSDAPMFGKFWRGSKAARLIAALFTPLTQKFPKKLKLSPLLRKILTNL